MEELRRIREQAGLSQAQLARESGVDRATINKIEQGKRSPSIATLESLSRTLGIEIADFFPKVQAPLPLEEFAAGAHVWEKVLNAARQDAEKKARAVNRLFASEGVMPSTNVVNFAEDEVRTELRNLGFPDALWEPLLWPLVQRIVELEQQLEAKEGKPEEHLESHTYTRQ